MIKVYGASDDLIEIDGYIREEFYYRNDDYYLGFSTGHLIRINYDGDWRLACIRGQKNARWYPAGSPEAIEISGSDYSEAIELVDVAPTWVVGGNDKA